VPGSRIDSTEHAQPGFELVQTSEGKPDVEISLEGQPPSTVWNSIATHSNFQAGLVASTRELLCDIERQNRTQKLRELGVSACHHLYPDIVLGLLRERKDISRADFAARRQRAHEADYQREAAHQIALNITSQFGRPGDSELGYHIPLEELPNGPLPILKASSKLLTIRFRFTRGFRDQRADQRRKICKLIRWLSDAARVHGVASGRMQHWLTKKHRSHLPCDVSKQCNWNNDGSSVDEVINRAHTQLHPDGREVTVLRQLAEESTQTLAYPRLRSKHDVTRSRLSQCVSELVDLGLVAKFEQAGESVIELLPAGVAYLEELNDEVGKQLQLDELEAATGQSSEHSREDSLAATSDDQGTSYEQGYVSIGQLSRPEAAAAFAGAPRNGIGLVDHPVERKKDGREPGWYYDTEADRLVVSAEWHNPMQYTVSIARALASPKTLNNVITADRLTEDTGLDALPIDDPNLLRNSRCLGYLSDRDANAEDYTAALRKARLDLEELTGVLKDADDGIAQLRSQVTREAHGLAGTLVHLLDLLDVEVIREVRLPHFRRDYSERRADILKNVAVASAIQSKYRAFAAFRQLFEDRDEKRTAAVNPTVDANDPYGALIGAITIVGPGVSDLEDRLHESLREPYQVHEDAPEFAVSIPVEDRSDSRAAFQDVIRMLSRSTEYTLDRRVISFLQKFTGTPYDAATAVHGLLSLQPSSDTSLRENLRHAVATLPPKRVLPSETKTVSKAVFALLTLDGEYTQKEVADEADVSPRSLRRHRETLRELGVLHRTDAGWIFRFPEAFEENRSWEHTREHQSINQPSIDTPSTDVYGCSGVSGSPVDCNFEIATDGGIPSVSDTRRSKILMGPKPRQRSLQDAVER